MEEILSRETWKCRCSILKLLVRLHNEFAVSTPTPSSSSSVTPAKHTKRSGNHFVLFMILVKGPCSTPDPLSDPSTPKSKKDKSGLHSSKN